MLRRNERGSAAASRRSTLQQLLRLAGSLQQHAVIANGVGLTVSDVCSAERLLRELKDQLTAQGMEPLDDVDMLWLHPSQDTSKFVMLIFLALRRSSPFAVGGGIPSTFASMRENLSVHFPAVTTDPIKWQSICRETVGPLLLKTDTLGCYARLLAEAAKQLEEAAAAALPAQALAPASGPSASAASASAATRSEGHGGQRQGGRQRPSAPGVQAKGPRVQQVDPKLVENLLCEVISVMSVLCNGMQQPRNTTVGSNSSSSSSSPAPAEAAAQALLQDVRAQLQSTWLLEHWARVLLLATAPALAGGNSKQLQAQTQQTNLFDRLCGLHNWMRIDLADFVRRPWGCSLAFIHMARLCAALDGADVHGLPRHDVVTLSGAASLAQTGQAAGQGIAVARQHGKALSLASALLTLRTWAVLLGEGLEELGKNSSSADVAEAGVLAGGDASAGTGEGQEVCRGSTEQGLVGAQAGSLENLEERPATRHSAAAVEVQAADDRPGAARVGRDVYADGAEQGQAQVRAEAGCGEEADQLAVGHASPRCLPPLNRGATFDLCLRLAKGVLANWGAVIPGVRVGAARSGHVYDSVQLLPESASAVLQYALACARLALLPDVSGRMRVGGRTRARLRAWWETYVAAAQHPEALLLSAVELPTCPAWIARGPGLFLQPFADSVAALEAGLLPCVTRLVTRMGAGNGGGAVWYPPDHFPGVLSCWPDLLLFGPLEQVAELASVLGRRLRLAVEQLRTAAVAAAGGSGGGRGGRSVDRLAAVAHAALQFAWARMEDVLSGALHLMQLVRGPREAAAAGSALRFSVVAAELLPALSNGVRACAELARLVGLVRVVDLRVEQEERGGGEGAGPVARGALRAVLRDVTNSSLEYTASALSCAAVLLARQCLAAAEQRQDSGGGFAAAGSGSGDGAGSVDTPWRQLLLRDVRLMELLGAAAELHCAGRALPLWREMSDRLGATLPLAAVAFPEEFRAAVQGGGEGGGGAAAEAGCAQASYARDMEWAATLEALAGVGVDSDGEPGVVVRVLRGWNPSAEEAWGVVRGIGMGAPLMELLRNMPPPAEARAAAAESAACASAPPPAPAPAPAAATPAAGAATPGG